MNLSDAWFTVIDWIDGLRAPWNGVAAFLFILVLAFVLRTILVWIMHLIVTRIVRTARKHENVDGAGAKSKPTSAKLTSAGVANLRLVQRARTMGTILTGLITWAIAIVFFFIALFYGFGVSPTAIVASAGITAAIVGFGAQNTIKDVINGLMIVFEDQIGVGDEVDLGLASGIVESVGVRVTTLRDEDGAVWYVRNGEILRIGNKSQTTDTSTVIRASRGKRSLAAERSARKAAEAAKAKSTDAGNEQQQRRSE
jgi:small conductance mechanosensitive channel